VEYLGHGFLLVFAKTGCTSAHRDEVREIEAASIKKGMKYPCGSGRSDGAFRRVGPRVRMVPRRRI
jgi:hypothetical protein